MINENLSKKLAVVNFFQFDNIVSEYDRDVKEEININKPILLNVDNWNTYKYAFYYQRMTSKKYQNFAEVDFIKIEIQNINKLEANNGKEEQLIQEYKDFLKIVNDPIDKRNIFIVDRKFYDDYEEDFAFHSGNLTLNLNLSNGKKQTCEIRNEKIIQLFSVENFEKFDNEYLKVRPVDEKIPNSVEYRFRMYNKLFFIFNSGYQKGVEYFKNEIKKVLDHLFLNDLKRFKVEFDNYYTKRKYHFKQKEDKAKTLTFFKNMQPHTFNEASVYNWGYLSGVSYELQKYKIDKYNFIETTQTEQETPPNENEFSFVNNFDDVDEADVYNHFKKLVEKKMLTKEQLNEYLTKAFQETEPPKTLFKLKKVPTKHYVYKVFYNYYKEVSQKPHGRQREYVDLLGKYFKAFNSDTIASNWSK